MEERDSNAFGKLQVLVIPVAITAIRRQGLSPEKSEEFSYWVMTWLYDKSESAYRREKDTDPLSYVYIALSKSIDANPELEKDYAKQEELFRKLIYKSIKNYAVADYIRSLIQCKELPKPAEKRGNAPRFISYEEWQSSIADDTSKYSGSADEEDTFEQAAPEHTPSSPIDPKLDKLKDYINKLSKKSRVTVRIYYYPALKTLSDGDVEVIISCQEKMKKEDRIIDIDLGAEKQKKSIEAILIDILKSSSASHIDYNIVGRFLNCEPNTANARVNRALKIFKTQCEQERENV